MINTYEIFAVLNLNIYNQISLAQLKQTVNTKTENIN
jgi:hypothetical protein